MGAMQAMLHPNKPEIRYLDGQPRVFCNGNWIFNGNLLDTNSSPKKTVEEYLGLKVNEDMS